MPTPESEPAPTRDPESGLLPPEGSEPTPDPLLHQRLTRRGTRWCVIGVSTLAFSCGLNFLLIDSGSAFLTAMYVLTIAGAICTFKGMVDILGF